MFILFGEVSIIMLFGVIIEENDEGIMVGDLLEFIAPIMMFLSFMIFFSSFVLDAVFNVPPTDLAKS